MEDISAMQTPAQPADVTKRGGEDGGKKQWKKRQREGREEEQKVKMGNMKEGVTAKGNSGGQKEGQLGAIVLCPLPLRPIPNPTGEGLSPLSVIQRGPRPSPSPTSGAVSPAQRLQTGEPCKQFVQFSFGFPGSCRFPGAIPFPAALGELPPRRPQPGLQPPPSPPFPQLSGGARVSPMRSGLCLSHPSRVAG